MSQQSSTNTPTIALNYPVGFPLVSERCPSSQVKKAIIPSTTPPHIDPKEGIRMLQAQRSKEGILSRAESVAASTPHMSPITRLQSQRHTPLPRPRHLESAPKPQVVDNSARDPGKEHAPQVRMAEQPPRDPEKRHATRTHASTLEIACDRGKKHVTQARDLSHDQTGPQQSRDPTQSRDQTRSRDQDALT